MPESSIDMEELNRLKEDVIDKRDKQDKKSEADSQDVANQKPNSGNTPSSEVNLAKSEVPPVTPPSVVFSPTLKEPIEDRALSATQKSSEAVGEMVTDIFKQGVVHVVSSDQEVRDEILDTAKKAVHDKIGAISDQTTKEAQVSAYDANSDACENYGIMKDVPKWKISMMKAGSAFWFIIYFIFASVTVAPITIFVKGLVGVIKQVWLAVIVAIVFYLLIAVGLPLLLSIV